VKPLAVVLALLVSAAAAGAQAPPPRLPDAAPGRPIGVGEIQRLFDAYVVYNAQEALGLSDAQYGGFVSRLKVLQGARRRHQQARMQLLGDLRRLVANARATPANENEIAAGMRALREEDDRAAAEIGKALAGVDEVLDVTQRARFRIFEERMEQRKLDLVMRARQAARGRGRQ
jgi:hypothetical protein